MCVFMYINLKAGIILPGKILEQELVNYGLQVISSPSPVFINKILFEELHPFVNILAMATFTL